MEVIDQTTETTQVMANPDGSFTLTSTREPIRVNQDGNWTPIDTTLASNSDGTLSPQATIADLTFSGGGSGPALTIADPDNGNAISFTWPTPLPTPTIDQDTATYSDVLPGVDLKLTAAAASYSEVLVVKDATAAANPALDQLNLQATASGLTLSRAAD
ncbi:MAG: LamG domain-containing protein, partial [Jatrophihabitantaceae bacterium]